MKRKLNPVKIEFTVLPLPGLIICFHLFSIAFVSPVYVTKSNLTSYLSFTATRLRKVPDQ